MMDFTDKAGSINELLARPGNGQCADCQKRLDLENAWGVLRYGVLVCQDCKLVHIALESQRKQHGLVEDPGILSCAKSQVWTPDDFNRFIHHGNDKTNQALLSAFPVWVYQPTPNDSISLKEQWISQKYRDRSAEENQVLKQPPKNAGTLCPVQFIRKSKNRTEPCAAVLHKEKLYLTSERRKEIISIVDVETALLTQDNGIMLAYREQDSPVTDEYLFAHLSHENQTVVLEWVNTLLYIKYKLLKEQTLSITDKDLGKLLNRYVIRQSYVTAGSIPDQLLFFVLSESRLAVFEHHLDEKPRYQTRIYQNHMTSVQYLTKVGDVLNIQVEKVYGYDEWLQALDQVLNNERLCSLPERLKAPSPINKGNELTTAMKNVRLSKEIIKAPRIDENTKNQNQIPTDTTSHQLISPNNIDVSKSMIVNGKSREAHCYPAIGPMGEMGKVARGELPAEAIRPPSSKQINGAMAPPDVVPPNPILNPNEKDLINSIGKRKEDADKNIHSNCYPPIGPTGFQPNLIPHRMGSIIPPVSQPQPVQQPMKMMEPRYQQFDPRQYYPPFPPPQRPDQWIGGNPINPRRGSSPPYQNEAPPQPPIYNERPPPPWERMYGGRSISEPDPRINWPQQKRQPDLTPSPPLSESPWPVPNTTKPGWNEPYQDRFDWPSRQSNTPDIWRHAEPVIDDLIDNGFVPASDMQSAQIDPNLMEHARFCAGELYNAVQEKKYDMALSFLRGFREIFGQSRDPNIRRIYVGYGEKDTLRNIVIRTYATDKIHHKNQSGWKPPVEQSTRQTFDGVLNLEYKRDAYARDVWKSDDTRRTISSSTTSMPNRSYESDIWNVASSACPVSRVSPDSSASNDSWNLNPAVLFRQDFGPDFLQPSSNSAFREVPSGRPASSISSQIWGSGIPSDGGGWPSRSDVEEFRSFRMQSATSSIWSTN